MSSQFDAIESNSVGSVLPTKIFNPKIGLNTLLRADLMSKLSISRNRRLTLVCAPAGYGKTTAVASWIHESGVPSAWVSLDKRDNDPVKFWSTVFAALKSVNSTLSRNAWDFLHIGGSSSWDAMISVFMDDMEALQADISLVFDDYHFITESTIHAAMDQLIQHGPSGLHIVIISREYPPFPIARLRAQRQIVEVSTLDLRFDRMAIQNFYRQVMKIELSSADFDLIEHHTEGWVAGMNLVALALRSSCRRTELLRTLTGNHHFIAEYLAEEVINGQPPYIQDFWLKTSILPRLSGSLCQAVTGEPDASELLQTLAQQSAFLIPLDDEHKWFRYHHLFADVLQERLLRRLPDEVIQLHRTACTWFESMNLVPEAIEHAIRGKDYEKATSLIYDYGTAINS